MKHHLTITTLTALTLAAAFPVQAADFHVPGDYATIQAAVNAAVSGDTVHIAAGVYREQVEIFNKNLSLIGQPGTIIRAFPNMKPIFQNTSFNRCTIMWVDSSTEVIIRNLTFEGDQLGGEQQSGTFNGVVFTSSGGVIEDCRFVGIRESVPGLRHCEAIEVFNDWVGAAHRQMDIRRNTIVDSYSGIRLLGSRSGISLTISIADNVVSGVGPSTAFSDMEGIEVQEGMVGEVARNTVSNFSYVGDGAGRPSPLGFGILGISTRFPEDLTELNPIRFEDNTLLDNQVHFALILCNNSTVKGNRIEGDGAGVRRAGLWFTGENVVVEDNDFIDLTEGLRVGGMDPDFGTILGFAENALLKDNRVCEVVNPINLQPQATATEQGTLLCPEPVLDIASAVLLSWPQFEDGYVVESAPAPDGPWTPLDVTPFLEAGQTRIAVATTGEHRFFRLRQP